jgi:hypothetical protein
VVASTFATCLHAAGTFLGRWRFWILGAVYLLVAWVMAYDAAQPGLPHDWFLVLFWSLMMAGLVASMAGLHLRRLLSGPQSWIVPGYAGPHLVVGAVASLAIWVAVPLLQSWLCGSSPTLGIAWHAPAGVLLALVLVWPRACLLLVAAPIAVSMLANRYPALALFFTELFKGQRPAGEAAMILVALAAYPLAATGLLLTRDRTAPYSDDLAVERSHEPRNRLVERLLALRDAAIEGQLQGPRSPIWSIGRWRVPGAVSWLEWGLQLAAVLVAMGGVWWATGDPGAGFAVTIAAAAVMLFIPLGLWRYRCRALAAEFMRPVSRTTFVRQAMAAMLWDFAMWTALASLVGMIPYLPLSRREPDVWRMAYYHLVGFWAIATSLYGVALATLRLRYWLPWMLGLFVASIVAVGSCLSFVESLHLRLPPHPWLGEALFLMWIAVLALPGVLLGLWTYRRWLRMEIA